MNDASGTSRSRMALLATLALAVAAPAARAGDAWDPFTQLETDRTEKKRRAPAEAAAPAATDGQTQLKRPPNVPEYGPGVPYDGGGSQTATGGGESGSQDYGAQPYAAPQGQYGSPQAAPQPTYGAAKQYGGQYGGPATGPTAGPTAGQTTGQALSPVSPASPGPATTANAATGGYGGGIEKGDLTPVIAQDGSGLPLELWNGLDLPALEGLLAKAEIPPRSPAIHNLWKRLITSKVGAPGGSGDGRFDALRADALYRSGLVGEAAALLAPDGKPVSTAPTVAALAARMAIAAGNTDAGCALVKTFIAKKSELPKKLQGESLLMTGICAAVGGNPSGAGLAAEFAREEKSLSGSPEDLVSLAALDAIATGHKAPAKGLKSLTLLQYRAFALAGGIDIRELGDKAEPALLTALAADTSAAPPMQLAAGEAAARMNALAPAALASLYRAHGAQMTPEALANPNAAGRQDGPAHRAALFKAAEAERTPLRKVRLIRSALDEARRAGLYLQTLEMLAKPAEGIQPVPEIGWFAETGIEIALASGNPERARQWAALGGAVPGDGGLRHWQPLIDLIDPALKGNRGRSLATVEELAQRGRLQPELLHRLATVLDANDIDVPIPLWDAANRTPQPTSGHLPETGVLTSLQDASKKREFGRTVLLVMTAIGPQGADSAHLISLGDSIRALRRAGLEPDARRLSFEALFAAWPRSAAN